jgi:hypothetical protein
MEAGLRTQGEIPELLRIGWEGEPSPERFPPPKDAGAMQQEPACHRYAKRFGFASGGILSLLPESIGMVSPVEVDTWISGKS